MNFPVRVFIKISSGMVVLGWEWVWLVVSGEVWLMAALKISNHFTERYSKVLNIFHKVNCVFIFFT
jgi:hypothetical protein